MRLVARRRLTFIAWGLYHGLLLILERFADTQLHWRPSGVPGIAATFVLLTIGWVFFRSPTLAAAGHYLAAMSLLGPPAGGFTARCRDLRPMSCSIWRSALSLRSRRSIVWRACASTVPR